MWRSFREGTDQDRTLLALGRRRDYDAARIKPVQYWFPPEWYGLLRQEEREHRCYLRKARSLKITSVSSLSRRTPAN